MIAGALICGFVARRSRSRVGIGYAPFLSQLITMVVRTGGGSMLPLGIILIGIIGLSGVSAAFVCAGFQARAECLRWASARNPLRKHYAG